MLKDNLIAARNAKNLTQQSVADYLNVKRQTYSSYERGVSVPDSPTLRKLAQLFGVPADELLGIEKSPSETDERLKTLLSLNFSDSFIEKYSQMSQQDIDMIEAYMDGRLSSKKSGGDNSQ